MSCGTPSSFRMRLALQTMLVAGGVLAAFGAGAWRYAREQQARNLDLRLADEARWLWSQLTPKDRAEDFARAVESTFGEAAAMVAVTVVWHAEGNPIADISPAAPVGVERELLLRYLPVGAGLNIKSPDNEIPQRAGRARAPDQGNVGPQRRPVMPEIRRPEFFTARTVGGDWRYGALSNPHYTLFVGRSARELLAEARRSAFAFVGAGVLALVVAGAGAWWASGRAIRPLRRIVATAGRMSAGRLDERIPVQERDDREFAQLILALNSMTARLQESFEQSTRFTADASHELKTPLAVMQGILNEVLRSGTLDAAVRERIDAVLHETSRMKHITHSLLLLAQADAGELPVRPERYDLSRCLDGLVEDAESLCQQAGLAFEKEIEPGLFVEADRALMQQVFQNLVSNAVKYCLPRGKVTLSLSLAAGGCVRFVISNGSDALNGEARRRFFDRFFRAETSRRGEGFGLGLNIAFELARANGARLELLPGDEGTIRFSVIFGNPPP